MSNVERGLGTFARRAPEETIHVGFVLGDSRAMQILQQTDSMATTARLDTIIAIPSRKNSDVLY